MAFPVLPSKSGGLTNMQAEHEFCVPVTIGSTATGLTYAGAAITVSRPSSTTLVITLPQTYNRITKFSDGRFPATSTSTVAPIITTSNVAVDGTITLTFYSLGVATAPANGDSFYMCFGVSQDQLNDRTVVVIP